MHSPATITIHLIDQPAGGIMVLTTAGSPIPGHHTPAQALAADLLTQCTQRASDVRYWQGEDKALAFVQSCLHPEAHGFAVNDYARAEARYVLGRARADTTPSSEVPA